ncbi:hypothetical protein OS189_02610 [Sulfitobacter sp. F26169L]|uniref:hypothetical protein n=1 Tax=Sulfitobacter sp. F26169L TaxID=2996015 RepID=UPI002260C2B9|nr:hypothetical protein [Sulfitobacter sp. F26169L]MCX7565236.1 hypothetical protein [Sulfitobacter sp. F26169L]
MQNWAVFTGDIVRSSDMGADALGDVFAALEDAARAIGLWPDSDTIFARFRGDGWQLALPVAYALRGALVLRAAVRTTGKGRDTRIGIGIGDGVIKNRDLAAADGSAFLRSGHALDAIKRGPLMAAPDGPLALRTALPLADRIAQGWTPKQAQVAYALLAPVPPTQEALAGTLGRSRQMTQKQAEAAGIHALLESCEAYETAK